MHKDPLIYGAPTAADTQQALRRGTYLREDIRQLWQGQDPLQVAFALSGEVYRDVVGRRTLRVLVADKYYFVKLHYGVGWLEIVKNWLQLKRPVVGAENEFVACSGLQRAGIRAPLVAAFARGPGNPAQRISFVLCDALQDFSSLEDVSDGWIENPPSAGVRYGLLHAVAHFTRQFHGEGFIHRDFYICHLLIAAEAMQKLASGQSAAPADYPELAVLDLHRARQFERIPERWLKRDLAALLYSTLDLGYSPRDWLRFVRIYSGQPLRLEMAQRGQFWRSVYARALALYRKGERKGLVKGVFQP